MKKPYFLLSTIFLLELFAFAVPLSATTTADSTPVANLPQTWLGMKPEEAYRLLGAPAEISAVADDTGHLHVIHYYPNYTYLFWYDNHVWQVRLDKRYTGQFLGLTMGMSQADVTVAMNKQLGPELASGPDWAVWSLPYQIFSRRLKLVFEGGKLVDAFFYRGDL
ncbi:MAG: hypothetical protein HKM05_02520 [Spirochaetales bacterium]|nr:hypothetical protein [Spirochaetales bacterium]